MLCRFNKQEDLRVFVFLYPQNDAGSVLSAIEGEYKASALPAIQRSVGESVGLSSIQTPGVCNTTVCIDGSFVP